MRPVWFICLRPLDTIEIIADGEKNLRTYVIVFHRHVIYFRRMYNMNMKIKRIRITLCDDKLITSL